MLEGQLVVADDDPEQALLLTLNLAGLSGDAIVTIYCGELKTSDDAGLVTSGLEDAFPGIQVDLIEGGQPHYLYLASIE